MPRGDGTGPMGAGPKTGRGMGYCSDSDRRGFANPAPGFGVRFDFRRGGMGRGWRHRFYATGIPGCAALTPEQETAELKALARNLQAQLDSIHKQIEQLESK